MKMKKFKIIKGEKYIVYIDTDDDKKIREFIKLIKKELSFKWWKPFTTRFIAVPKGVVEIKKL